MRSADERTYGSLRLNVKRTSVFEDSFNKLRSKTPAEMRAKLSVAFVGEEGIDAGGVSREWYQVSRERQAGPGWTGSVVRGHRLLWCVVILGFWFLTNRIHSAFTGRANCTASEGKV